MNTSDKEIPAISVIVPSYNSAGSIQACLESISNQNTGIPYEIIVVDSSIDNTPEIVGKFSPRVILIHNQSRLFPGPARNLGIERARGRIIAFTDADCVVDANWIENIRQAHRKHDAVGGKILNGTPGSPFGTALYLTEFAEFGTNEPRLVPSMPTCNMSYKKSVFAKYGVFPDVFWGEEYVLNTSIVEQVLFSPDVIVTHMNRTDFFVTVRHSYKVGNGCALSRILTNRQSYLFRYKFLIPSLWLYRFIKIVAKSAQAGNFFRYLLSLPFVLIDVVAWNLGFLKGAFEHASAASPSQDNSR